MSNNVSRGDNSKNSKQAKTGAYNMSNPISIGSIGTVVYDLFNDRWKGFLPRVHASSQDLYAFLAEVARSYEGGTRLTIRTLIGKDCQSTMPNESLWWNHCQLDLEAFVPVVHPTVKGIAYYGACRSERIPRRRIQEAEYELHQQVTAATPQTTPNGHHQIEWLTHPSETDVSRLVELYNACYTSYLVPFSTKGVRSMVESSRVMVVRVGETIVCICVAEMAQIPVPGSDTPLELVEISDAATDPNFRGQGMYKSVKLRLIQALRVENPQVVITTDARANSAAVIASNVHLGMQRAGYLPAHCVISSTVGEIEQSSRYGDLAVYYVP